MTKGITVVNYEDQLSQNKDIDDIKEANNSEMIVKKHQTSSSLVNTNIMDSMRRAHQK